VTRRVQEAWSGLAGLADSRRADDDQPDRSLIEVTIIRFIGALADVLRSTSPDKAVETHGDRFLPIALLIFIERPLPSFVHDLVVQQAIRARWKGRSARAFRRLVNPAVGLYDNLGRQIAPIE
jgi:hypothetical protein